MRSLTLGTPRIAGLSKRCKALAFMTLLVLSGCQSFNSSPSDPGHDTDRAIGLDRIGKWSSTSKPAPSKDVWERMRNGFKLQEISSSNPRIEQQRLWFASNPAHMKVLAERGTLYLHYVVEKLDERGMPLELALLPAIESAYNPQAYSRSHAAGLWQFIPSTGRHFNLHQTHWYDGRRDITASTEAALTYLERLHQMFNGDWLLALAAYNAGEGTVSRAIEANERRGLPTDYWNLPLPQETQDYVPKLLALAQVVRTPTAYGLDLQPIANEPYFAQVPVNRRVDLQRVAKMVNLELDEIEALNPAYKQRITMDGPNHLLIPTDKAQLLISSLDLMGESEVVDWQLYTVRPGDSLHAIAYKHQLTVNTLKEINDLSSNHLSIGQVLNIPAIPGTRASTLALSRPSSQTGSSRTYQVQAGDSLWQIARSHQVSVDDIKRWNNLASNALSLGQTLRIEAGSPPTSSSAARTASTGNTATRYQVRQGDSLYQIARRFNVDVATLQRWNPNSQPHNLKPGQTLTLYLKN